MSAPAFTFYFRLLRWVSQRHAAQEFPVGVTTSPVRHPDMVLACSTNTCPGLIRVWHPPPNTHTHLVLHQPSRRGLCQGFSQQSDDKSPNVVLNQWLPVWGPPTPPQTPGPRITLTESILVWAPPPPSSVNWLIWLASAASNSRLEAAR